MDQGLDCDLSQSSKMNVQVSWIPVCEKLWLMGEQPWEDLEAGWEGDSSAQA